MQSAGAADSMPGGGGHANTNHILWGLKCFFPVIFELAVGAPWQSVPRWNGYSSCAQVRSTRSTHVGNGRICL